MGGPGKPGPVPPPDPRDRDHRPVSPGGKYGSDMDLRDTYREGDRRGRGPDPRMDPRRPGSGQEREGPPPPRGRDWERDHDASRSRSSSGRRSDPRDPRHHHPDGRPHSGKRDPVDKKRDYFDKAEIRDRDSYDSDGYRTSRNGYDDDSYNGIEDSNAVMPKKIRDDIPDSDLIDYTDDGGESLVDSVPDMEYDDGRVRIFIALFDYDPVTMSPNPDAVEEELPFKEGQLLKVGIPVAAMVLEGSRWGGREAC